MKEHIFTALIMACLAAPTSALSAETAGDKGKLSSYGADKLLGLPALTSRGVKVGHVVDASLDDDGTLSTLIVDTSSSGSPYLDGVLQFDGGATDISQYRIMISISAAQPVK